VSARLEKLEFLKQSGMDPYPVTAHRDRTNADALEHFDSLSSSEKSVSLAGRVRSFRVMGGILFCHIEDETARLQIFCKKDALGSEQFMLFKNTVDIGDFVEVCGTFFTTKQGEKTLAAVSWRMLSKSIRPIPTEHFGMKDTEELLRKRYLDLIVNSETRQLFRKKNIFWQTVRSFLSDRGFLEVQTPVLENIPGGADAEPFITHHNALDRDFYLRISLELALKRLLVGGYEKVFEIGRLFRNEGVDREHLQEYDDVEFYWAYADHEMGMRMIEDLFKEIVFRVTGGYETEWGKNRIRWDGAWPRVDYFDVFKTETGIDLSESVHVETLMKKADTLGIKYEKTYGKGRMIDVLYKKTVRKKMMQPCFLTGHPVEISPLSKTDPDNPKRVLRVQVVAAGSELCNAFSELNDPIDQRKRFEEQMKLREGGDAEAQMLDEDFVESMEYGMPPAFGFGMSERFFSLLMNRSIRETVIFPPVREKN